MNRTVTTLAALFLVLAPVAGAGAAEVKVATVHALSLIGAPKYGPDFKQLDYVNPAAPKGGELKLYDIGGFDSLNPFIIKGNPAPGIGLIYESLLGSTSDDASAEYGLLAASIEVPEDLSWVAFDLRPEARWQDGQPVTAEDVIWSFNTLKENGAPLYRFYYANVAKVEALSPTKVKFTFSGARNRELPQIMGQLPVLPKHYWEKRDFSRTTLDAWPGSGPYRIKSVDANRSITFERVADYWGKDLPLNRGRFNFDTIRYDSYRDPTVALQAFTAHQYDFRLEDSSKAWATAYDFPALRKKLVVKEDVPNARPTGMQAFVYNTRRAIFADRRVREALGYAFDFEWSNKNLFYGQYTRTKSFFSNSELASSGPPGGGELKLLEKFRGKEPEEIFTKAFEPPKTDGSGLPRENLRIASKILEDAGWKIKDGVRVSPDGKPLQFEFLLVQPDFERVVAPFIRNLAHLGVKAGIRLVDTAQYQNRVRDFDFDIIVGSWGQSESPGNEQREMWTSAAAERPGSRNLAGVHDPVVDALVDTLIAAPDRASLVTATRALDRVLLWGFYVIPQWHLTYDRLAYWNKFGRTAITPKYGVDIYAWWVDPAKLAALLRGESELK